MPPDAPLLPSDILCTCTPACACPQHVHAHYNRTLGRPGSAPPSRPPPEAPWATWEGLARNAAELISNVSSASAAAQRDLALGGALRTVLDMLSLFTGKAVPAHASHTWVAEELLLAASKLIWCLPRAQTMLLEAGMLETLLRALGLCYSRISAPGGMPTQHDIVLYQATVLLMLNVQLENKPMQDEVSVAIERVSRDGELAARLRALSAVYDQMFDVCEHIDLNHFHSDEVVGGLQLVTRLLSSEEEAPYLFVHMNGRLDLLMRCLSNIDEEVRRRAPAVFPSPVFSQAPTHCSGGMCPLPPRRGMAMCVPRGPRPYQRRICPGPTDTRTLGAGALRGLLCTPLPHLALAARTPPLPA